MEYKFFPHPAHIDVVPWCDDLASAVPSHQYPNWLLTNETRYYAYLRLLIREFSPKNVVELGTFQGISALFMKSALAPTSRLATLDLYPIDNEVTRTLKLDSRVTVLTADTRDPCVSSEFGRGQVDTLYIDTDHNFRQIAAEWETWRPTLADGAIVVLDDIHLNPEMEFFWNQIPFVKLDTGRILHHSGFGMFQFQH